MLRVGMVGMWLRRFCVYGVEGEFKLCWSNRGVDVDDVEFSCCTLIGRGGNGSKTRQDFCAKNSHFTNNSHLQVNPTYRPPTLNTTPAHNTHHRTLQPTATMHLMYIPDPADPTKRIYTLKKVIDGQVSKSAHPARFSPDDKYSRHRVTIKKRYGLLLTQQSKLFLSFGGAQRFGGSGEGSGLGCAWDLQVRSFGKGC